MTQTCAPWPTGFAGVTRMAIVPSASLTPDGAADGMASGGGDYAEDVTVLGVDDANAHDGLGRVLGVGDASAGAVDAAFGIDGTAVAAGFGRMASGAGAG